MSLRVPLCPFLSLCRRVLGGGLSPFWGPVTAWFPLPSSRLQRDPPLHNLQIGPNVLQFPSAPTRQWRQLGKKATHQTYIEPKWSTPATRSRPPPSSLSEAFWLFSLPLCPKSAAPQPREVDGQAFFKELEQPLFLERHSEEEPAYHV